MFSSRDHIVCLNVKTVTSETPSVATPLSVAVVNAARLVCVREVVRARNCRTCTQSLTPVT